MWYVTNQKHGVSALGLQRILGLGSYQTAWAWLHKLRRAMVRPGRDLLGGAVEVDETYVGGRETGVVGRQTKTKSIVAIAAEVRGRGTGRIRMSRVEDVAARSLIPFVQTTVAPGATVRTDGWSAYSGLANQGYDHQPRSISASGDPAHIVMPRVHRVAALLDRWWLGIHHGAIDADHLDYYLDEFTFRFNRRRSQARGLLFFRLLQQAVQHEPGPLQGPSRRSSQPRKPNVGDTRAKWIPSIANTYLAGTNTRRVRRALAGLFGGKVGKDAVSRAWRKVKTDWESWQARDLSGEDIVRLILDGTGVKARLDGRVLSIPLLVVLGVRRDGQKVLLAVKNMGGETEAAWRHVLEDLLGRGLKAPELLIVDGGKGLEAALASLWSDIPVQRCTVHKERNLLAHAPKALHDEVKADYTDMMYAENAEQVRKKRKAFLAKWRLRCRGVADSLEEAGERLFTFLRYPPQQWKSLRTTNAIERLHGEFKRRVKTQCALPNAETAAMLFWALMASGQITMRRVGGWQTLDQAPVKKPIDLAA